MTNGVTQVKADLTLRFALPGGAGYAGDAPGQVLHRPIARQDDRRAAQLLELADRIDEAQQGAAGRGGDDRRGTARVDQVLDVDQVRGAQADRLAPTTIAEATIPRP